VDLSDEQPTGNCSILIVDDEPLIRINMVDFFIAQGFQVFEAENADHAIALLEENPTIPVVLTDVQMPGAMDGLRLAHVIRERWPPTLLVIVSGGVPLLSAALPSRATFIAKPFDPRRVLSEIKRLSA
jgi:DNA-binding NtrC family response regulator